MGKKDRPYPHDRLPKIKASSLMEDDDVTWMVGWIDQLETNSTSTAREFELSKTN